MFASMLVQRSMHKRKIARLCNTNALFAKALEHKSFVKKFKKSTYNFLHKNIILGGTRL